jgi:L-lactate dehydrogenase complex protein LldG
MSTRDHLLAKIRKNLPQSTPLPDLNASWSEYAQPEEQFCSVLAGVGGEAIVVADPAAARAQICSWDFFSECEQIVCHVPGIDLGNFDSEAVATPHELDDVDLAILPGQFAVAENGAVWVDDATVRHRVLYFLAQHLVIVVPRSELVQNMHRAYERISFAQPSYGLFISGPSKTADIEQSLVIGAHGPRSLHVLLMES